MRVFLCNFRKRTCGHWYRQFVWVRNVWTILYVSCDGKCGHCRKDRMSSLLWYGNCTIRRASLCFPAISERIMIYVLVAQFYSSTSILPRLLHLAAPWHYSAPILTWWGQGNLRPESRNTGLRTFGIRHILATIVLVRTVFTIGYRIKRNPPSKCPNDPVSPRLVQIEEMCHSRRYLHFLHLLWRIRIENNR